MPDPKPSEMASEAAVVFDRYAETYTETVNRGIGVSGEDVAYFAGRKVAELRRWYRGHGLPLPQRVLDFGCGTGLSTRALRGGLEAGAQVTGFDASPASIAHAQAAHQGDGVTFVSGDGETTPFPDAAFDAVVAACVFHHIPRAEQAPWARELARVVRPGGAVFLFEHNPFNPLTRRAVRACPFDEGVTLLRPGYARALLAANGWQAERPRFYFFFPAALRALRRAEPALDWLPLGAQYLIAARPSEVAP